MNISKRPSLDRTKIIASEDIAGTVFYKVTPELLNEYMDEPDLNLYVKQELIDRGFAAIDIKKLYGSAEIDGDLYICVTDYNDIEVDGNLVDPEEALEEYSVDQLQQYIQPATLDILHSNITEYEVDFEDLVDSTIGLLESGHSLRSVFSAYQDIIVGEDY